MPGSKVHFATTSTPPAEHALAVYGSLAPGRVNHHHLAGLRGTWREGLWVTGHLEDRGWGAGLGYPALVWAEDGPRVPVHLFVSDELPAHWARLDAFEGQDYERIVVPVHGAEGVVGIASLYAARTPQHADHGVTEMRPELYVSTDIEADGPIPGPNSMLSFASAAYLADKTLVGTFSRNLETLEGASADPKTAAWWKTQPEAWDACRRDLQPPETAMRDYLAWVRGLAGKPVFVGYPASFDFMFVHWYLVRFTGETPFSHAALDIKTFAMCLLGKEFRETSKKSMPARWHDPMPHTHVALDDALEQGALFCNMLAEARGRGAT